MEVCIHSKSPIGVLDDIVLDADSGVIKRLVVVPTGKMTNISHKVDENGRVVIEIKSMRIDDGRLLIEQVS